MKTAEKNRVHAETQNSRRASPPPTSALSAPPREKNSGWQTKKLGEVCSFDKSQGIHRGLPYVGLEHIESHTARFLGELEPQPVKSATFRFSTEHVLYGRLRPYLNKALAPDFEGHCSTEIFPLKPAANLRREYLLYWLLAGETTDRINATCSGARMPRADMNEILGFDFPLPPLPEQQRIVGILDKAFDGIATTKASAEKNLQNARALFESHLHAVFTHRGPGWVAKKLGDMCDRVSVGHVGPTSEFYCDPSEGIPFLRSQNVRPGRLDWDGVQHVTKEFHAKLKKSQLRLGDLLFVRVGANRGDCCAISEEVAELNCANIVFARPTHGNAAYLELYCQSSPGREQLLGMTTGSAQGVINTSSVAELIVPLPSAIEQSRIVAHLDALQTETRRLEALYARKLAALDELKTSLLHQAFSGQL